MTKKKADLSEEEICLRYWTELAVFGFWPYLMLRTSQKHGHWQLRVEVIHLHPHPHTWSWLTSVAGSQTGRSHDDTSPRQVHHTPVAAPALFAGGRVVRR